MTVRIKMMEKVITASLRVRPGNGEAKAWIVTSFKKAALNNPNHG